MDVQADTLSSVMTMAKTRIWKAREYPLYATVPGRRIGGLKEMVEIYLPKPTPPT